MFIGFYTLVELKSTQIRRRDRPPAWDARPQTGGIPATGQLSAAYGMMGFSLAGH
jgi:hypothetical protein